jgi:hypothetical protein
MKAIKARDVSVRDHAQVATIHGAKLTITSYVGKKSAGSFYFLVQDYVGLNTAFNLHYIGDKLAYLAPYTADLDNQSGGPEQADRIRESMVRAADKAIALLGTDLSG